VVLGEIGYEVGESVDPGRRRDLLGGCVGGGAVSGVVEDFPDGVADRLGLRASGAQVDSGAGPCDSGRHLGLVFAAASNDEGDRVGEGLVDAAVPAVGHHDIQLGE
jgi:hypothetical protein